MIAALLDEERQRHDRIASGLTVAVRLHQLLDARDDVAGIMQHRLLGVALEIGEDDPAARLGR